MVDQKLHVTIYLLKPDRVDLFEKELLGPGQSALPLTPPFDGYVLPLPASLGEPRWVSVIRSALRNPDGFSMVGQSPAALLVMRQAGKTFVVTFGHAWQKLEDDWLEPDFGRRVALNSIAPTKLVEINLEQVFAKWHVARERAPRASSVDEFSVEFDRDLVASVEGVPSSTMLGKTLRGGTSLRVDLPFSELPTVLEKTIALFESDAYKTQWPEIDNLSPVKDRMLIEKLEAQFDVELRSGAALKKIVMFTPTYRGEGSSSVDSYVFGRLMKSSPTTPYLMVESWINFLKRGKYAPSVAEARNTPIHLLDKAKQEIKECSAFDCFGYEVSFEGQQYVLSSGIWYEVVLEFLSRVNKAANKIPAPSIALPPWNGIEREGEYNLRCGKLPGFASFDTKNIMYGGGQSKFEFCDLLHMKSKTLFFAKIPSKSSGMSHLVEQVRRTTELLFSVDGAYRRELAKVIKQMHKGVDTDWLKSRPRHGDWNICLVSLGKSASQLPFFARCALVKVYRDLREQGHEVSFLAV